MTGSMRPDSFTIQRSLQTTPRNYAIIATGVTTEDYTNSGLTRGTIYCYQAMAVNTWGSSAWSTEKCLAAK
jgi:hypothetical protein